MTQLETHTASGDEALFWRAVRTRDARFDGVVYYAVRTTGVFCRPGCPSRRPRPENVVYFTDPSAAAEAGFRACRRCRPDALDASAEERSSLLAACRLLEVGEARAPSLDELAGALEMSREQVRALFRRTLGVSPKQYADALRLGRFKAAVGSGEDVAGATYSAGYGSSRGLYEHAGERLGMTPAAYRRGGPGEAVRYWCWTSRLGPVLVAATERGVCSVKLGAPVETLEAELDRELPAAIRERGRPEDVPALAALIEYLEDAKALPELPVDVVATAFQARVWAALRDIPLGETRTYSEVASAIGSPRAVRAVANACAGNPVALIVPCHRVVPKGGADSGGYRWGRALKGALLDMERTVSAKPDAK